MNEEIQTKPDLSVIERSHEGSLSTLEEGRPFVSAVGFVFRKMKNEAKLGGKIYILLSDLARHTRHLKKNPKASLLVVEENRDLPIHERQRLTILGEMHRVQSQDEFETAKADYLKAFPRSQVFFTLSDFRFYELVAEEIYWIGGFGKVVSIK